MGFVGQQRGRLGTYSHYRTAPEIFLVRVCVVLQLSGITMTQLDHPIETPPRAPSPVHKFGTLAVHAGSPHDPVTGAVIEPVSQLWQGSGNYISNDDDRSHYPLHTHKQR